jgi:hypothetical protein
MVSCSKVSASVACVRHMPKSLGVSYCAQLQPTKALVQYWHGRRATAKDPLIRYTADQTVLCAVITWQHQEFPLACWFNRGRT